MASQPAAAAPPKKPGTPGEKTKPADAKGKDKKGKDAGDKAGEAEPAEPTSGSGKFYYQNGAIYDGDWIVDPSFTLEGASAAPPVADGKPEVKSSGRRFRHGKGTFVDGSYSYSGEWDHDLMHGKGTFIFASGALYEGDWVRNRYQGKGAFRWKDGRAYTGDWLDNKMHGPGTYVDRDGHSWAGQFFNGSGPGLTCHV